MASICVTMLICSVVIGAFIIAAANIIKENKQRMNREELLNQLEEIQTEYKRRMHDAQAKEDYIFASGLCGATARIIKLVKDDKEQTEWDGTEIAPPIDSDVCG